MHRVLTINIKDFLKVSRGGGHGCWKGARYKAVLNNKGLCQHSGKVSQLQFGQFLK